MKKHYHIVNKRKFTIFILTSLLIIFTIVNIILIKVASPVEAETVEYNTYVLEDEEQEPMLNLNDYLDQVNHEDIIYLAKAMKGEANCTHSSTERSAIAWTILNQVDSPKFKNTNTVKSVVTRPNNIQGYKDSVVVTEYYYYLAKDILCRYYAEKDGWTNVGRTIPSDYYYWMGNGVNHNYFTKTYHKGSLQYCIDNGWDWSLESPYED